MLDKIVHQWLRVPYSLHVHTDQRVKKPRATILFIHGIGNSGTAWDDVISRLPSDLRLVTIDLLGFGHSQRPSWIVYDAATQARSVIATFLKLRIRGKVIIVGHSLGSLVAVEIAKRYPLLVKSLILCSPPFYHLDTEKKQLFPSSDRILNDLYRQVKKHPEEVVKLAAFALKLGLVNKSFSLTHNDAPAYMNALEASIINQTSLNDAIRLKVPMQILYGKLDPVVVLKNLRTLERSNASATVTTLLAAHEVQGATFIRAVTDAINQATGSSKPSHKQ